MAKYYLEITGTTGAYRIGGGGGALCQRFTDADCFPQSFGRSVGTGISSGASMGVAFVVLLSGSLGGVALSKLGFMGEIALTIAAIAGSLSIMALIVFVSQK